MQAAQEAWERLQSVTSAGIGTGVVVFINIQ